MGSGVSLNYTVWIPLKSTRDNGTPVHRRQIGCTRKNKKKATLKITRASVILTNVLLEFVYDEHKTTRVNNGSAGQYESGFFRSRARRPGARGLRLNGIQISNVAYETVLQ